MMETRPDPDALLAAAEREPLGRLKIFLGAAPGVGKTWEMLAAAQHAAAGGRDVVAGLIETHNRAGTIEQIGDLDILPRQQIAYRGQTIEEFDLDAALARRPGLLLVDELAHTNAPGLRHAKRWQDIEELLDAGIDVWTTVNVQHLESLNDQIARITGVRVTETIPDTILERADEIELIDLPPAELRARLTEGRIYRPDIAARALDGFFRPGNLGALREMALRRVAARVDRDVTDYMRASAIAGPWPVAERVLALVSSGPSETIIRHAARLAEALRAPFTAFHAERAGTQAGVQAALDLAVQLGGTVTLVNAADEVAAALAYAAQHNVTHILLRRSRTGRRLLKSATAYTLHFIPSDPPVRRLPQLRVPALGPYAVAIGALVLVTLAGLSLSRIVPSDAMGLIFTGLIAAIASRYGRNPALVTAIGAFLAWDVCFLPPVYELSVADPRDLVALIVFLLVGLVTGSLAGRVQDQAASATARIEALRRISLFGQLFARATTRDALGQAAVGEAAAMGDAGVLMLAGPGGLAPLAITAGANLDEAAVAAAEWAFTHNVETGHGTTTLPAVPWRFLPLVGQQRAQGVLGVRLAAAPLPPVVQALDALAAQAAMALERLTLTTQAAQNAAQEDSQKLRTALLSSLSHDLRTPLTAIRGAAETLALGDRLSADVRDDLLASITQDTTRMTRFLSNIMDFSRVETGEITPRRAAVELATIIEAAIARTPGASYAGVSIGPQAGAVLADPTLLEQVLVNILENAVKYAPEGSRIAVSAARRGAQIALSIADEGVGIPPGDLQAVFDSFYRASQGDRVAPGTGLGLAIAKAFTEAMGGTIRAQSPRPDLPADGAPGTTIHLTLPAA
jgi:two-component system sensor histidine kinase KdpD